MEANVSILSVSRKCLVFHTFTMAYMLTPVASIERTKIIARIGNSSIFNFCIF